MITAEEARKLTEQGLLYQEAQRTGEQLIAIEKLIKDAAGKGNRTCVYDSDITDKVKEVLKASGYDCEVYVKKFAGTETTISW